MRVHRLQIVFGAIVVGCITSASPTVDAQEPKDLATAEALFDAGLRLMREGEYTRACPKFEESLKIDTGIGATLWLADCYEKSGRLASAWSTFRQAAWLAQQEKDDRQAIAQQKLDALEPRVPKLMVTVGQGAAIPELRVERDGVALAQQAWGVKIPVDPGKHDLVARAPGRETWRETVDIAEAQQLEVEIPLLSPERAKPVCGFERACGGTCCFRARPSIGKRRSKLHPSNPGLGTHRHRRRFDGCRFLLRPASQGEVRGFEGGMHGQCLPQWRGGRVAR